MVELPPPPQAIMKPSSRSEKHMRPMAERLDAFLLTRPRIRPSITTPATGSVNGSQGDRERLSARRRTSDPVPVFGPAVVMVIVTPVPVVEDVPAAIDGGVKVQRLLVSVVSVGAKAAAERYLTGKSGWAASGCGCETIRFCRLTRRDRMRSAAGGPGEAGGGDCHD